MEVREDLHAYAREHGVNMSALLNKSLEDKRRRISCLLTHYYLI